MPAGGETSEIGILLYPGVQMAAVHGLTDLFAIANRLSRRDEMGNAPALAVSQWHPARERVVCISRSDPPPVPRPRAMILPPTLVALPDEGTRSAIARWLLDQHAGGVGLVTVCSGIFLLAGTGLLDGRAVSTHRSCAALLADSYPRLVVDAETRLIEHPGILTAGGFMAWIDVGLILVERLLGQSVRDATARFLLSESAAAGSQLAPHVQADGAIRRAQELVYQRDGQGLTLEAMARAAGLARRTFLRRFMAATGTTPVDYCRAVRLARAQELLLAGQPPKRIAEALGYPDVSSFSRSFRRGTGMPPGAYRRSHDRPPAGHSVTDPMTGPALGSAELVTRDETRNGS